MVGTVDVSSDERKQRSASLPIEELVEEGACRCERPLVRREISV